ncbi:MAG TPA: DUF3108 domain-containing protein [Xanthomonadales bacterium]
MSVTPLGEWLFRSLFCVALTAVNTGVFAADCGSMPVAYTANYSVTRNNDKDGAMQVVLQRHADNTYSYRMDTRVQWGIFTAQIEQQSDFSWRDGVIFPGSFQLTQKVSLYKRSETAEFDWVSMKATGTKKRRDFEVDLQAGMQDKLTIYLLLARSVCEGKIPVEADVVSGPVLKRHSYQLVATETLDTVLGLLPVLQFRRGATDDEKQTDLWLAEALRFLPVKLVYRDENEITVMQIENISFAPAD